MRQGVAGRTTGDEEGDDVQVEPVRERGGMGVEIGMIGK